MQHATRFPMLLDASADWTQVPLKRVRNTKRKMGSIAIDPSITRGNTVSAVQESACFSFNVWASYSGCPAWATLSQFKLYSHKHLLHVAIVSHP